MLFKPTVIPSLEANSEITKQWSDNFKKKNKHFNCVYVSQANQRKAIYWVNSIFQGGQVWQKCEEALSEETIKQTRFIELHSSASQVLQQR